MDILRQNTTPILYLVPREDFDTGYSLSFEFTNEATDEVETIESSTIEVLPNEIYKVELTSFPISEIGDKFSYNVYLSDFLIAMGKLLISSEDDDLQNYNTNDTNDFYK